MAPVAPARFSITMVWPSASPSGCRDEARHDVAGAARRIGDDDVDGAVREILRGGRNGGGDQSRATRQTE
jgi:hypothetical protein